ncbi:phosphocholine cytidylyltransferase family protein [Ectopseudomonas alcaliphila]|uniref:phosphocholine cytidylyltransferase family protein n=1 Tax=Ectopseudomonas alcaliphila TaxID=101564 RepID=UPI00278A9D8C|nr:MULTISPECIES: phosphocholine cytidylyltransferase family protein [Pseudomonas]MDP9940106.1 choline kinase [Pseudomonas sp. 3400]MDR7012327.1 choline kinase [Pseudomonas alcaliphila]
MRAVILAAGQGSRLRPYTDDRPKCMVSLFGKPMLHRQLEVLRASGINDITLVGGYKADALDAEAVNIVLNPRYAKTNMVSTLFCAESVMTDDQDLLILYGDVIYEPKVLESLLSCDCPLAISVDREWRRFWELRMENPLADAETLKLQDGNRIVELGKKPSGYDEVQGQYMGLIKVRADVVLAFRNAWHVMDRAIAYDGKDFDNMYMTSFLQYLIDQGWDARAAFTDNGWLEVDTVEDLEEYELMQRKGLLSSFIQV